MLESLLRGHCRRCGGLNQSLPRGENDCLKQCVKPERNLKMSPLSKLSLVRCERDTSFGPFRLTKDGELHFPGATAVQLSARLACILFELARKNGAAVSRTDLLELCWPEAEVGEENLTRAIADLRRIFRVHGADPIETVYGLGYRLKTGRSGSDSPDAISFCKEAWHRVYQRQRATLDSAEDLFGRVAAKDGDYLPAWLGLAETQIHRMQLGYATAMECAPRARKALDRALELEPACADALAFKGLVLTWAEWNFVGAEALLRRACELSPNDFIANQAKAYHELGVGELEAAARHFRAASSASPMAATARAGCAFAQMYLGNTSAALDIAREMVRVDAYGAVSLALAAIFEAALGDATEALSRAERSFELLPESPVAGAILAYALARARRTDEARALLGSTTKSGFLIGSNTMAAPAWMELGDASSAMSALEAGFAARCPWLLQMLRDPRLDALTREPLRAAIGC